MLVLLWILDKLRPIIFIIGFIFLTKGVCMDAYTVDRWLWIVIMISTILGGIFGVKAWNLGIPPRWLWVKSPLELFDNQVGSCLQWAFTFFLLPFAIYGIVVLF